MSMGEEIRPIHVLTHPKRYEIIELIRKEGPKYIAEISEKLGINRKIVSFHLKVLEREEMITTYLEQKEPPTGNPVLVRYAKLTKKAEETLKRCRL
jgi:predicted ArsR family transcriptional regulator